MRDIAPVTYPLTIYFDGSCGLCRSEIENLARRGGSALVMIDCSAPDFDTAGFPATQPELMNLIHARDAAGGWITGVDVFIAAYGAAQLGWVARILAHPRLRPLADAGYPWLVRNRYRIAKLRLHKLLNLFTYNTRRRAEETLARTRACKGGACALPTATPHL